MTVWIDTARRAPTAASAPSPARKDIYEAGDSQDRVSDRLAQGVGYGVRFPRIRQATWESANGWLYAPDDTYMPLFISEYSTSFTLAGSTGQSQMVRDFYARNFTMPDFTIQGQSPNQYYYNRLGEFIRHSQRQNVLTAQPTKLIVTGGGYPVHQRNPRVSQRGRNEGFVALGYIKQIARGAERFEWAPDFTFAFTVAAMLGGLYKESPAKIRQLRSWAEIFKDEQHVWEVDPDYADAVGDGLSAIKPPPLQAIQDFFSHLFG
jgi:hypothetical protein